MAKKRKAARKAPAKRKSVKRRTAKKTVKRAAAKKPARRAARKPAKAKPAGIGTRIAAAVGAVIGTLSEAEQLHQKTVHKAGFQELE
jgi:hypothetical protein